MLYYATDLAFVVGWFSIVYWLIGRSALLEIGFALITAFVPRKCA